MGMFPLQSMDTHVDSEMIQQFEVVKEVISNVRSIRLQKNISSEGNTGIAGG